MKRLILLAAATLAAVSAAAEGYQVNNLSSRQNGMAHVGTAMKLGAESIWFNPAAAVYQTSKFDISFGITGVKCNGTFRTPIDYTGAKKQEVYKTQNPISTPIYLYANYKATDWMSVGLAFNTPFGSSVDWGKSWAGAHQIQDISLAAYNIQPTLSFRIAKGLTAGVGMMVTFGNFDLSRSMLPVSADDPQNMALTAALPALNPALQGVDLFAMAQGAPLASLGLEGSSKVGVGVNLGVMWDINEQWSIGMTYRSKIKMKVDDGSVAVNLIDNPQIQGILGQMLPMVGFSPADIAKAKVKTELPMPATLTWGVSFRPAPRWEFAVDLQYVMWSAYDKLDIAIDLPYSEVSSKPAMPPLSSEKNYSNTLCFRFGGQYKPCDWFAARMGFYADESPVDSNYLNPETPSMTKLGYSAGLTISPVKWFDIDLAYAYVNSADPERTGSSPYKNTIISKLKPMLPQLSDTPEVVPFAGNYKAIAHTFSIGFRFKF